MTSQRVGPYRLLQLIGTGGMGQVHRCADERGQLHAIKLLRDDRLEDPELGRRFEREIEVLRQLVHPHIVHLTGEGTHQGRRFYVMNLLEQGSLADLLDRGPLAVPFALRIARQLLAALGHAHARRHVHRDIKPSNIRFDAAGNALLIDFGLAKSMDGGESITADGTMLGTLAYMAPEQVRGEAATPSSDLYQLGVVLYEMLTGALPYAGSDVLRALATGHQLPYPAARAINPQIPPAVDDVVARLLSHDPLARPRSAEEAAALVHAARPPTGTTGPQPVLHITLPAAADITRVIPIALRERAGEAAGRAAAWVAGSQPVRTALACSAAAALVIVIGLRFEIQPAALPALAGCHLTAQPESTDLVVKSGEACHAFLELAAPGERPAILFNRKAATKISFRGLPVLPGRTYQARVWLSHEPRFPGDAVGPVAVRTFRAPSPPLPAPAPSLAHGTAAAHADSATARRAIEAARLVSELKPRTPAFTAPETPTTRENFDARLKLLQDAQARIAREIAAGELRFPEDELEQLRRLYKVDATLACERLDIDLAFLASAAD